MISGLEELVLKCPDETSRGHIREAIKCYEAGSYRAAIVTTYISLCFDLIEKIRVLSAAGDAEAQSQLNKLENLQRQLDQNNPQAIPGLLEFERNLLEVFRDKFDFFGVNEFDELERLRRDRNRCAHPTFLKSATPFAPSAELARLHIRNALVLVLSQQPKQGKAALESLESVILSANFPKNENDAIERLKGSEIANGKPSLIKAFVDEVCFGYPNGDKPFYKSIAALVALIATVELHRAVALPRVITNMNKLLLSADDLAIHFGGVLAVRIPDAGEETSPPARVVIKAWMTNPETVSRANAIRRGLNISWLSQFSQDAVSQLTSKEISKIKRDVPDVIVSHTAKLYSEVQSWNEANKVAAQAAVPLADKFSEADLELVLTAAETGTGDLQGSGGFKQFVDAVCERNPIGKEEMNKRLEAHNLEHYKVD